MKEQTPEERFKKYQQRQQLKSLEIRKIDFPSDCTLGKGTRYDNFPLYLKLCNNKPVDAIVLILLLNKGFTYPSGTYFPYSSKDFETDLGLPYTAVGYIADRLAKRFNIERKVKGCSHYMFHHEDIQFLMELHLGN